MSAISFDARLFEIDDWVIIRLPEDASAKLPSRGMVMIEGTVNGHEFRASLEPDGKWRHWFRVDSKMLKELGLTAGDTVRLQIEPLKEWPRPELPDDIKKGLAKVPEAQTLWGVITPKAQWEWIRWIRATNNTETRQRRIEVACSKMKSGERRPCCFNSNMCTEPAVSKNGQLLEPAEPVS